MEPSVILFEGVSRRFGSVVALDDVSFELAPGTVLGLIGRNGAGKTTALRLALGTLWPDRGRIRTLGLDPMTSRRDVATRAALLSEEAALYAWMTIAEIVHFTARLQPRWDHATAERLMRDLDLDGRRRIRELSRGTRAKVALVLAVAARPALLLLDDPTAGLDPLVRREVLDGVLAAVSEEGGAVIYASHLVHDVERVADRVIVLDHGKIRLEGALDELKARFRCARAVFPQQAPHGFALPGAVHASTDGRVLTIVTEAAKGDLESKMRGLGALEILIEPLPLEEILVAMLREGQQAGRVHA